jgi:homoserine dehydrogenase
MPCTGGNRHLKTVTVGLLGCGTVGEGLLNLLAEERDEIAARAGVEIRVTKALVRRKDAPRKAPTKGIEFTTRLERVIDDPQIDVVVELIGGTDVALKGVEGALRRGKHVVTANKAIISQYGDRLLKLAAQHRCGLAYEGAVAASIPILQSLDHGLAGEKFDLVAGILNGTTNVILTRMGSEGAEFADALAYAQEAGFAEADPTLDISGQDTAHKLVILVHKAFGVRVPLRALPVQGIDDVTPEDIEHARQFGYGFKLLGIARVTDLGLDVRVHPMLLPIAHPLASVSEEFNAIYLHGRGIGPMIFYGRGAGSRPTARAVLGDLVKVASDDGALVPRLSMRAETAIKLAPAGRTTLMYYFRVTFTDQPHVLATVTNILDECRVEVHRIHAMGRQQGTIVMLTHPAVERNMQRAISRMNRLRYMTEPAKLFPMLEY